jgi:hypothetical protein
VNHYLIELDLDLAEDMPEEQMEALFDALADQVADLAGMDGDVSADLATRTVTIHLSIGGRDDEAAFALGLAAARTAVHAAGLPTPGWEKITLQPTPVG